MAPKERRHCVAFMMATEPQTTNEEIAAIFGVSERMIRKDKDAIRAERAKIVKDEDLGFVVADIVMMIDRQLRDIEKSKAKCALGSRTFLEHCVKAVDIVLKKNSSLQDLGFYPKTLGNMIVQRFDYKAVVGKDGSVDTRPLDLAIDDVIEAEFEEQRKLPAPNAEFDITS